MRTGKSAAIIIICLCLAAFTLQCGGGGSSGGGGAPPPGGGGGGGPITLSSLSPIVAMQSGAAFTLTVSGSGFVSGDQVVFNGASESTTVASGQQLTAQIPSSALATPSSANGYQVTVQGGGQTSTALVFFVVPAISASAVTVSEGGTTQGVNISVPSFNPPSLQLQSIGGTTSGEATSAGESAIVVSPGQTLNLFVVGNGLVAGAFFEVTGGGVTVTQPLVSDFTQTTAPVSPAVNFSVVISSSAVSGPRNLIVTNPAGEISIYPGGIVIAPGS